MRFQGGDEAMIPRGDWLFTFIYFVKEERLVDFW